MLQSVSTADAGCYSAGMNNNLRMDISEKKAVRRRRFAEFRQRHKTDADAASALGISGNYYSQIKHGRREVSEETARKFEQVAGLEPMWFDGYDQAVEPISERETVLIRRFRRLDPESQSQLLGWLAIQRTLGYPPPDKFPLPSTDTPAVHEKKARYKKSAK